MIEYSLNIVGGKFQNFAEVCNDGMCQYKRTSTRLLERLDARHLRNGHAASGLV